MPRQPEALMTAPTHVAPDGWWALADAAAFYPEDLPDDWRLTYFANSYPAVFVPEARWRSLSADTLSVWAADVHAGFRFYLEAGMDLPAERRTAAAALGQTLAALVDTRPLADAAAESGHGGLHALHDPGSSTTAAVPPLGVAARCPPALNRDLRGARAWLDDVTATLGEVPRLIVLERPSSVELERWRDLLALLGVA
jgi:hypothetical protein